VDYTPDQLLLDAAEVLAAQARPEDRYAAIGDLLRRLGRQPDLLSGERLAGLHGTGATATTLAVDPAGRLLMLARFPAEAPTPIHNHNSWGVLCVVEGRDRHVRWERMDDGSDPSKAIIREAETRELGPEEVLWLGEPPLDIHSQQGIGGAAWELVFFGRDPFARPRAYFDPETGAVSYEMASR
jgi:predicted metal-dependent enzyme (double-stranded beta helix superfamily)